MLEDDEIEIPDYAEKQWEKWKEAQLPIKLKNTPAISTDEVRDSIIHDLSRFCEMSVKEYTLWEKWEEINIKYETTTRATLFDGDQNMMVDHVKEAFLKKMESNIWTANDPDDYLKIEPRIAVETDAYSDLRNLIHTMKNTGTFGRALNVVIEDAVTGKYLGVVTVGGDYLDLGPRDKYIGWDREEKTNHMIKHTAVCSSISPVQPFGFNYVGGKLLSLICISDEMREIYESRYKERIAGMTTTSLYGNNKKGGLSQYDNLKYWKKMGYSKGEVSLRPTKKTQDMMRNWLIHNHPKRYFIWYHAVRENRQQLKRDHINRSYAFVYSKLKIPNDIRFTGHGRGVYFAPIFKNTNEFLRGEIAENELIREHDFSLESLTELWKHKYARQRINSLVKKDRVSSTGLFYRDMIYMTWDEAKERYLSDVGR